jgi:hypothetical protein
LREVEQGAHAVTEPHDEQHLSVRPGTQAGWITPLFGEARCTTYGHELENRVEYLNGMIIGYCSRCSARVEITWFRGGTMAPLARYMIQESLRLSHPSPTVLDDLEQVAGLLSEDIAELNDARRRVRRAQHDIIKRIGLR